MSKKNTAQSEAVSDPKPDTSDKKDVKINEQEKAKPEPVKKGVRNAY